MIPTSVKLTEKELNAIVKMAQEGLYAMCDSDGFKLALQNPGSETDGLEFSILDTPDACARIGLLHNQNVQESNLVKTYAEAIRRTLQRGL